MKEESIFLEFVGDSPTTRLIQFLVEGREMDYTMTDMTNAGISWTTLHRIFPKMIESGIVKQTRTVGRAKLFRLNKENLAVQKLVALFDSLIFQEIERVAKENLVEVKSLTKKS